MLKAQPSHGPQLSLGRHRETGEAGFTLVELMVSLFIFGILAAGGAMLLGFSVNAQASAKARLDDVATVRRLGAALTGDLAQAVPRTTRSALGDRIPAFRGSAGQGVILSFVRAGWSNSGGAARASLQRVDYRLDGNRLERVAYAMLDGGEPQATAVLLRGVQSIRMRYRKDGEWIDAWAESRPDALPRAVEMVIDQGDGAPVRQVFVTGSGYRQ